MWGESNIERVFAHQDMSLNFTMEETFWSFLLMIKVIRIKFQEKRNFQSFSAVVHWRRSKLQQRMKTSVGKQVTSIMRVQWVRKKLMYKPANQLNFSLVLLLFRVVPAWNVVAGSEKSQNNLKSRRRIWREFDDNSARTRWTKHATW